MTSGDKGYRGTSANLPQKTEKIGLPMRPFFWMPDQIAVMLNVKVETVKTQYLYYEGRSTGVMSRHLMVARNIASPGDPAVWRIAERELMRWLKVKGFKIYEVGVVTH